MWAGMPTQCILVTISWRKEVFGDRLPVFTEDEKALLKGPSDFFGMNMYTSFYIRDAAIMTLRIATRPA
jgi:hypothetical protein